MIFFAVAFALLLHVLLWGAGLAVLAMPRPWRRFWPVLALPAGFALQSLVVWAGAYANLRGTNSYGWPSELVPLALLVVAARRRGLRQMISDLGRFGVLAAVMAGCLALVVLPMAVASRGLTTLSLGSCDAADYAAGARVLMEFARADRVGFLGLTEVVRVASVDNFFDFWLRLNHFTPSALLALNGTILHCPPHELTGVFAAVLLAASLPVVFWTARAVLGYSGGVSVLIAMLYGLSPLGWYAVAHVTLGQWFAAQAIALLTWAGVALWRGKLDWRFSGVLAIGYALVLGAYNFMLLVCLVPALTHAGGLAWWRREFKRLARWLGLVLAPLAVTGAIFFERVAGLAERFRLFRTFDFGWKIPALSPEGWLGIVSGPNLEAWSWGGLRWVLTAGVVALLGWSVARAVRERRRSLWIAASLVGPALAGYAILLVRGARAGTNASYDAYKLFCVFFPLLLPALCWWVTLRWSRRLGEWLLVVAVGSVVLLGNLAGSAMIAWRLGRAPLRVDGELRALRKIEAMPDVKSINLLVPDMWSRLWANEFLLRKPQYFPTDTYEARWHTPLRGDWDLEGGLIAVNPPGEARRQVTPRFALVDTRNAAFLRADFGDGWHPGEQAPDGTRWRWTKGDATLRIENPHPYPLTVRCTIDGWSLGDRDVSLVAAGGRATPAQEVGEQRVKTNFAPLVVPPGASTLVLHSARPAIVPPGDVRALGLCVFGLELAVARP